MYQVVNVSIDVEVSDEAADDVGERIVADALLSDDRIKLVTLQRSVILIDR